MDGCPGQDTRNIRPEDIIEIKCPSCGELVELWPPGYMAKCPNCGNGVAKEEIPSCADWCPGGEALVKQCLGEERYQQWKESKTKKSSDPSKVSKTEERKKDMPHYCAPDHNCIKELRLDHEKILAEVNLLEKAVSGTPIDLSQVKNFLHFTETFAEPHHRKEEEVLFPELEKRGIPKEGGPIGVMLQEHEIKRGYVKGLKTAVEENNEDGIKEGSRAIIDLLRAHIDKENNILYPMAESILTQEDLEKLGYQCSQLDKN